MKIFHPIYILTLVVLMVSFNSCHKKEEPPVSTGPRPGTAYGSMVFNSINYSLSAGLSGSNCTGCGGSPEFYILGLPSYPASFPQLTFVICGPKPTVTTTYTCGIDNFVAVVESSTYSWNADAGSQFTVTVNGSTLVATTTGTLNFTDNSGAGNTTTGSGTITAH